MFRRRLAEMPPISAQGWPILRVKLTPPATLKNWSPRSVSVGSRVKAAPPNAGIAIDELAVALATLLS
ncbi:hypothetical protein D3C83_231010 [compost metagenome]